MACGFRIPVTTENTVLLYKQMAKQVLMCDIQLGKQNQSKMLYGIAGVLWCSRYTNVHGDLAIPTVIKEFKQAVQRHDRLYNHVYAESP